MDGWREGSVDGWVAEERKEGRQDRKSRDDRGGSKPFLEESVNVKQIN